MISTTTDTSSELPTSTEATDAAFTSSQDELSTVTPTEENNIITTSNDSDDIEYDQRSVYSDYSEEEDHVEEFKEKLDNPSHLAS